MIEGPHVKCPVFLSVMNKNCNLLASFGKTFQYKFLEVSSALRELLNTYREPDIATLKVFVAANCIAK